jgi:hypothetical protein
MKNGEYESGVLLYRVRVQQSGVAPFWLSTLFPAFFIRLPCSLPLLDAYEKPLERDERITPTKYD